MKVASVTKTFPVVGATISLDDDEVLRLSEITRAVLAEHEDSDPVSWVLDADQQRMVQGLRFHLEKVAQEIRSQRRGE